MHLTGFYPNCPLWTSCGCSSFVARMTLAVSESTEEVKWDLWKWNVAVFYSECRSYTCVGVCCWSLLPVHSVCVPAVVSLSKKTKQAPGWDNGCKYKQGTVRLMNTTQKGNSQQEEQTHRTVCVCVFVFSMGALVSIHTCMHTHTHSAVTLHHQELLCSLPGDGFVCVLNGTWQSVKLPAYHDIVPYVHSLAPLCVPCSVGGLPFHGDDLLLLSHCQHLHRHPRLQSHRSGRRRCRPGRPAGQLLCHVRKKMIVTTAQAHMTSAAIRLRGKNIT